MAIPTDKKTKHVLDQNDDRRIPRARNQKDKNRMYQLSLEEQGQQKFTLVPVMK